MIGIVLIGKGSLHMVVQIAAAVAGGDGLERIDKSASTPEAGQIHAFVDPISAMGRADSFFFYYEFEMLNHNIMFTFSQELMPLLCGTKSPGPQ